MMETRFFIMSSNKVMMVPQIRFMWEIFQKSKLASPEWYWTYLVAADSVATASISKDGQFTVLDEESSTPENNEVFVTRLTSTGVSTPTQPTKNTDADDHYPVMSKDNKVITFWSNNDIRAAKIAGDGNVDIYTVVQGVPRSISEESGYSPVMAVDGELLAYTGNADSNGNIISIIEESNSGNREQYSKKIRS